ncbi:MAG: hypothetical protein IJU70_07750 [Lentisphaeria bacterium]|nr:hypothetical protein [Lentisphaeria bacterium]
MIFGRIKRFLKNDSGAVTMEYVLLCVLIAAGSMLMVVTFSRAVARRMALVSYAMAGYSSEQLKEGAEKFKQDTEDDVVVSNVYLDYMQSSKTVEK